MIQESGPERRGSASPQNGALSALLQKIDDLDRDIAAALQSSEARIPIAHQPARFHRQLAEASRRLILVGERLAGVAEARGEANQQATVTERPGHDEADRSARLVADARAEAERIRADARRDAEAMLKDAADHLADMATAYREAVRDARLTVHRLADAVRRPIEPEPESSGS